MTQPKAAIPMGANKKPVDKGGISIVLQSPNIRPLRLIAGERLQAGDLVRIGRNGKAYRCRFKRI